MGSPGPLCVLRCVLLLCVVVAARVPLRDVGAFTAGSKALRGNHARPWGGTRYDFRNITSYEDLHHRLEQVLSSRKDLQRFVAKEHAAKLHAMAYFFQIYNKDIDQLVQKARVAMAQFGNHPSLPRFANQAEGIPFVHNENERHMFKGRASLFEPGGPLRPYIHYVHELADLHRQPAHVLRNISAAHAISLIEERMELGLIEVTNYHRMEKLNPIKEARKVAQEPYFVHYYQKRKALKQRQVKAAQADTMRTAAASLKDRVHQVEEQLAKADRPGNPPTREPAPVPPKPEEQAKTKNKLTRLNEMNTKSKHAAKQHAEKLAVLKAALATATAAYTDLKKNLRIQFEHDFCFSCEEQLKRAKHLLGPADQKKAAHLACNCDAQSPPDSDGGARKDGEFWRYRAEHNKQLFDPARKDRERAFTALQVQQDEQTEKQNVLLSTVETEEPGRLRLDFEIVEFPQVQCDGMGGLLSADRMFCTQEHRVGIDTTTRARAYTFQPKMTSGTETVWTHEPSQGGYRLHVPFEKYSSVEFNLFGKPHFQWTLPKGKRVEFGLTFHLNASKATSCQPANNDGYRVAITEAQQRREYDGRSNPFFDGHLKGEHYMEWSGTRGLTCDVSNYDLGIQRETVSKAPGRVSMRIPYASQRTCKDFMFTVPAKPEYNPTSVFPVFEVRTGPYAHSCMLESAGECTDLLVRSNQANLSPRLCKLLAKVNVPALNEWRKAQHRCPDMENSVPGGKLEEAEKRMTTAEQAMKTAENEALNDQIASVAENVLAHDLQTQHAPTVEDADVDPTRVPQKDASLTPTQRAALRDELKELKEDLKDAEANVADLDEQAHSGKDHIVCRLGQPASERKGAPGSFGGPNVDGDPSDMDVDAEGDGAEPPGMGAKIAAVKAAHKARVVAWKAAAGSAMMLSGAGGVALGGAKAAKLADPISKLARAATGMAMGMVMTAWMGKQSAPWIYDGRLEKLCMKAIIVEQRDWCNHQNNDCLTKCPSPGRPIATMCTIMLDMVTDPGIETLLKNPPPVGVGPAPPFVMPPCMMQGQCQKPVGDDMMLNIIQTFQDTAKEISKKVAAVADAFAGAAASSAKAAAAMSLIDIKAIKRAVADDVLTNITKSVNQKRLPRREASTSPALIETNVHASTQNPVGPAIEGFGKALLNGYAAEVQFRSAAVDLLTLKHSVAKNCPKIILRKKLSAARSKLQGAQKEQQDAIGKPDMLKKQEEKMKKGAPTDTDPSFKVDAPFRDQSPDVTCPPFDVLGCSCTQVPSVPTLGPGDCKEYQSITLGEKKNDFAVAAADNFFNMGKGEATQMKHKAKMAEEEGDGLDDS